MDVPAPPKFVLLCGTETNVRRILSVGLKESDTHESVELKPCLLEDSHDPDDPKIDWEKFLANIHPETSTDEEDSGADPHKYLLHNVALGAPLEVFEAADLVIIYFSDWQGAFASALADKSTDGPKFHKTWDITLQRAKHFLDLYPKIKTRVIFVEDKTAPLSVDIEKLDELPDSGRESFEKVLIEIPSPLTNETVERWRKQIKAVTSTKAASLCAPIIKLLKTGDKEDKVKAFEILQQILSDKGQAYALGSKEQKKDIATTIISRSDINGKTIAQLFTQYCLDCIEEIPPERLEFPLTIAIKDQLSLDYEPTDPPTAKLLRLARCVRTLCRALYVVHHYFLMTNPAIFPFCCKMLMTKNFFLVLYGYYLLENIFLYHGEEVFPRHFAEIEQPKEGAIQLPQSVAVAGFEAAAYILQPIRRFQKTFATLPDSERQAARDEFCDFLSSQILWPFQTMTHLFQGYPPHSRVITPRMMERVLNPLRFALQFPDEAHPLYREVRTVFVKLYLNLAGPITPLLRFGTQQTIEKILENSNCFLQCIVEQLDNDTRVEAAAIFKSGSFSDHLNRGVEVLKFIIAAFPQYRIASHPNAKQLRLASSLVPESQKEQKPPNWKSFVYEAQQKLSQVEKLKEDGPVILEEKNRLNRRLYEIEATQISQEKEIQKLSLKKQSLKKELEELRKANAKLVQAANDASKGVELKKPTEAVAPQPRVIEPQPEAPVSASGKTSLDTVIELNEREGQLEPEDLEGFINLIASERRQTPESMKPSVCGMLKHLGEELYSSKSHFIQEMFQNIDDNEFVDDRKSMEIFLGVDYIAIGNNEKGMRPSDVLAICSAASSMKRAGVHTGQKGLGFKAVFAISNSPIIISKNWSFSFSCNRQEKYPELGYITPTWVKPEVYPPELSKIILEQKLTTVIHLPFKDDIKQTDLKAGIKHSLDSLCLLCSHNINKISLTAQDIHEEVLLKTSEETIFKKRIGEGLVQNEFFQDCQLKQTSEEIKVWKSRFEYVNIREDNHVLEMFPADAHFVSFEAELSFPLNPNFASERRVKSQKPTKVRLIFPSRDIAKQGFPVFATLPVIKTTLPFILQADWDLVTSRENIKETSWNSELLKVFSGLFQIIIENHPEVKSVLEVYFPDKSKESTYFWKSFVKSIRSVIKGQLPSNLFLHNPDIDHYLNIPDALFVPKIQIYREGADDQAGHSNELLRSCRDQLSMLNVVEFFKENESLRNWVDQKPEEEKSKWWKWFFELMNITIRDWKKGRSAHKKKLEELLMASKKAPIFLVNRRGGGHARREALAQELESFVCTTENERRSFYSYRDSLSFLCTESSEECDFLLCKEGNQMFKKIDTNAVIKNLLKFNSSQPELAWKDLEFLSQIELNDQQIVKLRKKLMIPTTAGVLTKNQSEMILMTVLGITVGAPQHFGGKVLAAVPRDLFSNLVSVVNIESFLIRLGFKSPEDGTQPDKPVSLPPLTDMANHIPAILKLLDVVPPHIQNYLSYCLLPVDTPLKKSHGLQEFVPARQSCASFLFQVQGILPVVVVPENAIKVAKFFGIATKISFDTALRVLLFQVDTSCPNKSVFVNWLANASSSFQDQKFSASSLHLSGTLKKRVLEDWIQKLREEKFLALSLYEGHLAYYSTRDIYCLSEPDTDGVVSLAASLLEKPVIYPGDHLNGIYSPFTNLLQELNCKKKLSLTDLIRALFKLKSDRKSYLHAKSLTLSPVAMENAILLYQEIEKKLVVHQGRDQSLDVIKEFIRSKLRKASITEPIPLLNREVAFYHQPPKNLIQTPIHWFSKAFHDERMLFVLPELAQKAPLFLKALEVPELKNSGILQIDPHAPDNIPSYFPEINRDFSTRFGREVNVVVSHYHNVNFVCFPGRTIRASKVHHEYTIIDGEEGEDQTIKFGDKKLLFQDRMKLEVSWMIVQNYVFFSGRDQSRWLPTLQRIFENLLVLWEGKTQEEAMQESNAFFARFRLEKARVWNCEKPILEFDLKDVAFPAQIAFNEDVTMGSGAGGEMEKVLTQHVGGAFQGGSGYGGAGRPPKKNHANYETSYLDNIFIERLDAEHDLHKIDTLGGKNTDPYKGIGGTGFSGEVDQDAIMRSGFIAELFVFRHLQRIYPSTFKEANWVSSQRNKVFPSSGLPPCDDGAGYDFYLTDSEAKFHEIKTQGIQKCFIEVKGTTHEWKNTFMVSRNEFTTRTLCLSNKDTHYVLLFVEWTSDPQKTRIHGYYNWTENHGINLIAQTCEGKIKDGEKLNQFENFTATKLSVILTGIFKGTVEVSSFVNFIEVLDGYENPTKTQYEYTVKMGQQWQPLNRLPDPNYQCTIQRGHPLALHHQKSSAERPSLGPEGGGGGKPWDKKKQQQATNKDQPQPEAARPHYQDRYSQPEGSGPGSSNRGGHGSRGGGRGGSQQGGQPLDDRSVPQAKPSLKPSQIPDPGPDQAGQSNRGYQTPTHQPQTNRGGSQPRGGDDWVQRGGLQQGQSRGPQKSRQDQSRGRGK